MGVALIVDDEPSIRDLIQITLERMDYQVHLAATLNEAKTILKQNQCDFCLTDMRLPDGEGLELVQHIQQYYPDLPVAVLTAYGSVELAVSALKAGAFDFVSKPVDITLLRNLVKTAMKLASKPQNTLTEPVMMTLIGDASVMQDLRQKITKLARSQAPVYIFGASGVGKELVARLIHDQSPRVNGPFVAVNCGAIPSELMESEFFGHKRGSFTGAVNDKIGLFQAANGGTLFLDEVGDLPLNMQVKLLRVIQEKAVRPVGEQKEIAIDVRILSATHQDLRQLVLLNQFRQDLFYRINVIELMVPTLAERKEDIPLLVKNILQKIGGKTAPDLSPDALASLMEYPFPGNVRELENILERAVALCEDMLIRAEHLQLQSCAKPSVRSDEPHSLPVLLDDIEKQKIVNALNSVRWNKKATSALLGISLRALRYRLKKLGIE